MQWCTAAQNIEIIAERSLDHSILCLMYVSQHKTKNNINVIICGK